MVNDKVGPSQFKKLSFLSKDDNPQKLDNRVMELFKELGRLCRNGIRQTRKLRKPQTQTIIKLIVTQDKGARAMCKIARIFFYLASSTLI